MKQAVQRILKVYFWFLNQSSLFNGFNRVSYHRCRLSEPLLHALKHYLHVPILIRLIQTNPNMDLHVV